MTGGCARVGHGLRWGMIGASAQARFRRMQTKAYLHREKERNFTQQEIGRRCGFERREMGTEKETEEALPHE
eukprot:364467-Chlamydomonas_euryale.AAC.5